MYFPPQPQNLSTGLVLLNKTFYVAIQFTVFCVSHRLFTSNSIEVLFFEKFYFLATEHTNKSTVQNCASLRCNCPLSTVTAATKTGPVPNLSSDVEPGTCSATEQTSSKYAKGLFIFEFPVCCAAQCVGCCALVASSQIRAFILLSDWLIGGE